MNDNCHDCDQHFLQGGGMLMLPDDLWQKITNDETKMLLCANCIMKRIGEGNVLFVHALTESHRYKEVNEVLMIKTIYKEKI